MPLEPVFMFVAVTISTPLIHKSICPAEALTITCISIQVQVIAAGKEVDPDW
jgi:hypothetical protein